MYLCAAGEIEDWLLRSNIQLESGAEAGAVAGWLTERGVPSFAYPEITGYYLTCMAFVARFSPRARFLAGQRASKAVDWLARWALRSTPPPTRLYLQPHVENDWRNAAVFSFDLAMVARGIAHASGFSPSCSLQPLLDQYLAYLLDLCTPEGKLLPVKGRDGRQAGELPSTWSTLEGVHHLKAAAAILSVPEALLPARLSAAACNLVRDWAGAQWQRLQAIPLHQLFYYLEGLVLLATAGSDPGKTDEVATVYAAVMQQQDASGFLRSVPGAQSAPLRSDVIAQALRTGSLLKMSGHLQGGDWDLRLEGLASALLSFVGADGAVSQYPLGSTPAPQWNAWCSMFAYQALAFYGSLTECEASTAPGCYSALLI